MTDGPQENRPLPEHLTGTEGQEELQDQTLQQKVDTKIRRTADAQEKGRTQAEEYIKQFAQLATLLTRPALPTAPGRRRLEDLSIDESDEAKKKFQYDQEQYKKEMATYQTALKSWEENRAMRLTKLEEIGKNIIEIGIPALEPLLNEYLSLDQMISRSDPLFRYRNFISAICSNNPRAGAVERVFLRIVDIPDDPVERMLIVSLLQNIRPDLQNQVILGFMTGEAWERIYPPLTGALAQEFNSLAESRTPSERKTMEMRLREYLYHFRGTNQEERGWPLVASMLFRRPPARDPMELLMAGAGSIVQAGGTEFRNSLIAEESDAQRATRRKVDAADQRKFDWQMRDWRNEQQPFTAERGLLTLMQRSDWGQLQSRLDEIIDQVDGTQSRENLREMAVAQIPYMLRAQSNESEFVKTNMQTVLQRLASPTIEPSEEIALITLIHAVNPNALNDVLNQRTAIRLEIALDLIEDDGFHRLDAGAKAALWRRAGPVILRAIAIGGEAGRRALRYAEEFKATENTAIIPEQDWQVIQKYFESLRGPQADSDDRWTVIDILTIRQGTGSISMLMDILERQTNSTPLEERLACIEACATKHLTAVQAGTVLRAITTMLESAPVPLSDVQLSVTGAAGSLRSLALLSATDRHRLHMCMAKIGVQSGNVKPALRRQIITQLLSVRAQDVPPDVRRVIVTNEELRAQNRYLMEAIRRDTPTELLMELVQRPGEQHLYTASQAVRMLGRRIFTILPGSGAPVIDPADFDAVRALIGRYRNLPETGSPEYTADVLTLRIALQEELVEAHSVGALGGAEEDRKILQRLQKQITDLGIEAPPPEPQFEE